MKIRCVQLVVPMNTHTAPLRMTRAVLTAAVVAALLIVSLAGPASADDDDDDGGEYAHRQIVVKLQPTTDIGAINRKYDTRTISRLPGGEKIYLLRTPRGANPENLALRIAKDTRVIYAETNLKVGLPEASRTHRAWPGGIPVPSSNAANYRDQYAVGALNLVNAHGIDEGAGSVVAVIDTGVQANHSELSGKLTGGYDFVNGDSKPADVGNGKDDDRDGVTDEMVGHGTHVAGIVGLVAPEAQIMPVRALDSEGRGTAYGIARAIRYAVGSGADVVNLSLGSSQESELLEDLIGDDDDDSAGRDAVFVAAAGNDNDSLPQYPAAEDGAIAVTSVDQNKAKSGFASYGSWVTVAAPGSGIYSLFPTDRYASWDGTSMATPFVAGQAALVHSASVSAGGSPSVDSECVADAITSTAQSLDSYNATTYHGLLGSGHADAWASVLQARSNPCAAGDD